MGHATKIKQKHGFLKNVKFMYTVSSVAQVYYLTQNTYLE